MVCSFIVAVHPIVWLYPHVLNHPTLDERLSCVHLGAIVYNAAVLEYTEYTDILLWVFWCMCICISLGHIPRRDDIFS